MDKSRRIIYVQIVSLANYIFKEDLMGANSLFNQFTAMYRPYIKQLQPIFDEFNLYSAQWLILKDIAMNGPTTLVQISKRRAIEKPTTRKILKVLSEKSLLHIEQGSDKREKILSLSPEGQELYEEILHRIEQVQNDILQNVAISEEQIKTTVQTMELIHESIIGMEDN